MTPTPSAHDGGGALDGLRDDIEHPGRSWAVPAPPSSSPPRSLPTL
eukprot:CAMPEP_0201900002 /NCGR_PEP_ID=MMETSP0902-20130614/51489_1 /ASSEMBLY_ACC=CAM_ASM_000551 /TAXON_ID=420261 /ORGANISM="Thalassiosira antarctica, Strain CCMP982" /LENGTH=45 /DNA_ID= /DNA_START= /DNA_END= /DNA_ORIENTATION=